VFLLCPSPFGGLWASCKRKTQPIPLGVSLSFRQALPRAENYGQKNGPFCPAPEPLIIVYANVPFLKRFAPR